VRREGSATPSFRRSTIARVRRVRDCARRLCKREKASGEKCAHVHLATDLAMARIGADRQYGGLISKNPLHRAWRVEARRQQPYSLHELSDWLFADDMKADSAIDTTAGAGRNVTLFDELRNTRDDVGHPTSPQSFFPWSSQV